MPNETTKLPDGSRGWGSAEMQRVVITLPRVSATNVRRAGQPGGNSPGSGSAGDGPIIITLPRVSCVIDISGSGGAPDRGYGTGGGGAGSGPVPQLPRKSWFRRLVERWL